MDLTNLTYSFRVIHDYIIWQTIFPMLPYLSSSFRSAFGDFLQVLWGDESGDDGGGGEALWQVCVSETQYALGEATGALFVQDYVQKDTKKQVRNHGTSHKPRRCVFHWLMVYGAAQRF